MSDETIIENPGTGDVIGTVVKGQVAPNGYRVCAGCGVVKPISLYSRSVYGPSGYMRKCKKCVGVLISNGKNKIHKQEEGDILVVEDNDVTMKSCIGISCNGKEKKITAFGKTAQGRDGHKTECKSCVRKRRGMGLTLQMLLWNRVRGLPLNTVHEMIINSKGNRVIKGNRIRGTNPETQEKNKNTVQEETVRKEEFIKIDSRKHTLLGIIWTALRDGVELSIIEDGMQLTITRRNDA